MTEFLFCFSCCIGAQPQPRRRRIDRSMIGEPMNFIHTAHVGSGEANTGFALVSRSLNRMFRLSQFDTSPHRSVSVYKVPTGSLVLYNR
uniref:CRIB domain-containing protein n=1 Tax=Leptobrachium leishanense TaxID=445787 RepID=A0A8C5MES0_9ANUR